MHKYKFGGYHIVQLQDATTREAVRYWADGMHRALLQKNGNVAIAGSGFFKDDTHPVACARVARALVGLKLYPEGWAKPFEDAEEAHKRKFDMTALEYDAERLGMKLVPME